MKAKLLLAALVLPLVFTACSQDELENSRNNGNIPSNAIEGLKLNIQKSGESDGVDTRGTWLDETNKISFDKTDKISLYWLGLADQSSNSYASAVARDEITGKFNSIFRTDNGTDFSSESLVFEGGNIAVYPGDLAFVKEGEVSLNVPAVQDASVLNNIPYISNQLWIKKQGDDQTEQLPGYYGDKVLDCPVKQAANVVNLKLNLSNIPAGYGFEVQSVELATKSDDKVFTTKSNITTANEVPNYKGEVLTANLSKGKSIVARTWSAPVAGSEAAALSTKNITKVDDKTVIAHFVVLPTDAQTVTSANAAIIVRTNCGTITLNSEDKVPNTSDLKNVVKKNDGSVNGTDGSIADAIKDFVTSQIASEISKFKDEEIGKTFNRSIAVDVAEAKLNNSLVYTSEDIIRYVNLHTAMNSEENPVNLLMTPVDANISTIFAGLTKAAVDKVDAKNADTEIFKLAKGDALDGIEIVGGGNVFDVKALVANANLPLYLSDETWSMDDKLDVNAGFNGIVNKGTLTINGTMANNNTQNKIVEAITNAGTINLGGNDLVVVGTEEFKTLEGSEINIAANQELQFSIANNEEDLKGTINVQEVTAKLTATADIYNKGVINNNGIVAGNTTNGWVNKGTINIKNDLAITYVKDNTDGTIVLKNRNDEVKVDESAKNGKIVYVWKDGATFTQTAEDRFTYVVFDGIGKLTVTKTDNGLESNTSMEFKGLCSLTAANVTIKDMTVAAGADFRFTSGNKLTVTNLTNEGTITIGGEIVYATAFTNTEGRVLTTGAGAIRKQ